MGGATSFGLIEPGEPGPPRARIKAAIPEQVPAGSARRRWPIFVAAALYLLLSVALWSKVWLHHSSSTTTCGCGDASLFTWFLEWPAYALSHGLSPIYSTAMFYPRGVNLLANTSQLALGVVLAPVSWVSGPIMTLNVALTLSPALSALAMFLLIRRWASWLPAAFVGGLLYGFSPYFLANLSATHLMVTMAVVPPLFVLMMDEILVRQHMRPVVGGVLLAALVVLQFFIGTETLVLMLFTAAIGVVVLVAAATRVDVTAVQKRARRAAVALGTAGLIAVVSLAYPAWFALAGPGHYSGPIWSGFKLSQEGATLQQFFATAHASSGGLFGSAYNHTVGGYQGPVLSFQFIGIGVVVVLVVGLIVWRRDARLWLFGGTFVVTAALSLGSLGGAWAPWRLVVGLPLFVDIIPNRFLVMTYLAAAVMVGLIMDHTRSAALRSPSGLVASYPERAAAVAGLVVATAALVPLLAYLAPYVPLTARPVRLPTWFRTVAPQLPGRQVLLVIPTPFSKIESAMTWQAVNRMHYSMVGGAGPGDLLVRAGPERQGQALIAAVSYSFTRPVTITQPGLEAVHRALVEWSVDKVVIPDEPGLPPYDLPQSVTIAAALTTAATGELPRRQAGAWVWSQVKESDPISYPTAVRFSDCTRGLPPRGAYGVSRRDVVRSSRPARHMKGSCRGALLRRTATGGRRAQSRRAVCGWSQRRRSTSFT